MLAWLRAVPRAVLFPAFSGLVTGLWIAFQEISADRYPAQGLWRTVLSIAGHDAMVGSLIGVGGGVLVAVSLTWKQPATDAAGLRERRLALGVVLTAALALAISLLPAMSVAILGHPAREVFGVALFVFWAGAVVLLLPRTTEETGLADSVEEVWTVLVWLLFVVFLAHVWARLDPGLQMAYLACGGLLAALALYVALDRPVKALARRVSGCVRRPAALRRLHSLSVVGLGLSGVLWIAAGAEARHARGELKRSHPNLLIIAVDTLRADAVTMLERPSHGWDTTPNLRERLGPRGTYFTRAYSQAPWTMPSFASVFTGLYPEEHGAQAGNSRLLPHQLTLAEILRDRGYRTMAVVSGHFISSEVGMLQGFDSRDESQVPERKGITSEQITDRALGLIAARREAPFFMFVHYIDPHYEYKTHPGFHFADPKSRLSLPQRRVVLRQHQTELSPQDLAQLKALYAEDIGFTDQHIGRLLSYLDEHRLWGSTCVVLVADHGDEFLEHGGLGHSHTVFEELVHVPLLVADPSRNAARVVSEVVETRWLFGTVLEMLGLRRAASRATTHNVFSPPQEREHYARSSIYRYQSCLIGERYKVIDGPSKRMQSLPTTCSNSERGGRGAGRIGPEPGRKSMLFDLLQDPSETKDLSEELPEVLKALRSALETINGEVSRREEKGAMPRLSEEQKRRLRALGYL